MRSRALTPASPPGSTVLRYAFQFECFEPALFASALQCASAPSRPPRSAPLPLPTLVTKNVMPACWACTPAVRPSPVNAAAANNRSPILLAIGVLANRLVEFLSISAACHMRQDDPWHS